MSTAEVAVRRPQRWDTPFSEQMNDELVDHLLQLSPFRQMDESRFPKTCGLRGILRNDARIATPQQGDIVVREGDYGSSAFLVLEGSLRVFLESLPRRLLGRPTHTKKNIWKTLRRQLFSSAPPELREYGCVEFDQALGWRSPSADEALDDEARVFLQDIPGVLDQFNNLQLGAGEIFGELAAMTRSPRSATIVADEASMLFEIRWQGLRDLMRYDPQLKQRIDHVYRQNSLASHLRATPLLRRVSKDVLRKIADETVFETFGRFDWNAQFRHISQQNVSDRIQSEPVIAEEGNYPDGLIMIRSGFARLSRRYGNGHRTLAYLGKGQTFCFAEIAQAWSRGEVMPLHNSLRAVGYVDILRIPTAVVNEHILPTLRSGELKALMASAHSPNQNASAPVTEASTSTEEFESGLMEFLLDKRFINGTQAMLINADRCTRCDDCVRACASTHEGNPRFIRHGPSFGKYTIANACMHCADPVCMIGCPTGAIAREEASGNVTINDATCIGCSTCANSCPYLNIRMVETRDATGNFIRDSITQETLVKATKCDLCVDNWGGPACQRACPHDALVRIDISDSQSLMKWIRDNE